MDIPPVHNTKSVFGKGIEEWFSFQRLDKIQGTVNAVKENLDVELPVSGLYWPTQGNQFILI